MWCVCLGCIGDLWAITDDLFYVRDGIDGWILCVYGYHSYGVWRGGILVSG